ncbi:MAG: hypothetical protein DRQ59_16635 [Gammaproteobacteria bacterium]|nr:MAG: hypothetical protein DRQ59_16635 [Gammaproteobacteria bacterium]
MSNSGTQDVGLEQRLDHVEEALGLKAPALEKRLEKVEGELKVLDKKNPSKPVLTFLDYVIKFLGALTPIIVLIVGFEIKDSVDLAIQERELSIKESRLKIDEAKALDGLLKNFRKSDIGVNEANRTALMILDYGSAGIKPLIQDLNVNQDHSVRAQEAQNALKINAVMSDDRQLICSLLGRINEMQPPVFYPQGLQRVTALSKDISCRDFK